VEVIAVVFSEWDLDYRANSLVAASELGLHLMDGRRRPVPPQDAEYLEFGGSRLRGSRHDADYYYEALRNINTMRFVMSRSR
jgi:hypothetical protein